MIYKTCGKENRKRTTSRCLRERVKYSLTRTPFGTGGWGATHIIWTETLFLLLEDLKNASRFSPSTSLIQTAESSEVL